MQNKLILLAEEIANAAEKSFLSLFENKENYYYCVLVTTGEALPPFISAWSFEALETFAKEISEEKANLSKWFYGDSPYFNFEEENFKTVRELFYAREKKLDQDFFKEVDFRVEAMIVAMELLDKKGIFSLNQSRDKVYINVEVVPPDHSNTLRALRLNKKEDILDWLNEAAEDFIV
ncbi:DUF4303 domain-containing protein [Flavobacterium sp.]|uniref:DUF4303 domain-containing protein n=1 Tax=Flavobacterium sp. TaxID=239 RepID=UPI0031DE716F